MQINNSIYAHYVQNYQKQRNQGNIKKQDDVSKKSFETCLKEASYMDVAKDTTTKSVIYQPTNNDYCTAKKALNECPDVREDRINTIKKQIQAGTYEVSMEDFATKLLCGLV